jgi:hypothetical protein
MYTPITFVTVIKNRTNITVEHEGRSIHLRMFENNLRSLLRLVTPEDTWEFLIIDFMSDDVHMETWVKTLDAPSNISIKVIPMEGHFNKGRGLNFAAKNATYPIVFFLDADMEIRTRKMFDDIERYVVGSERVLFPVCWSYSNPEHTDGWKRIWGVGNVVQKKDSILHYMEKSSWGHEDCINFLQYCLTKKAIRTYYEDEGFIHQWHPEEREFKNKHYVTSDLSKKLDTLSDYLTPLQLWILRANIERHM